MSVWEWICALGIPALVTAYVVNVFKSMKAIKLGVQACLRAWLFNEYEKWLREGFCPVQAREICETSYLQYHALGANGVMDGLRAQVLALPTIKKEEVVEGGEEKSK